MNKLFLTLAAACLLASPLRAVSITEFGAVGDGKTLNTARIQAGIDRIASGGGSRPCS